MSGAAGGSDARDVIAHRVATAVLALLLVIGSSASAAPVAAGADLAAFGAIALPAMPAGATVTVSVPVTNTGTSTWTSPPVFLAYHWYAATGALIVWDGQRTAVGAALAPGASRTIAAQVVVPATARDHTLVFDLVREGVAWFGGGASVPAHVVGAQTYRAVFTVGAGASAAPGAAVTIPVSVLNAGTATWAATGSEPVALAYHVYDAMGRLVLWDGARTSLGSAVVPGQTRSLSVSVSAPGSPGDYIVRVDLVREGIAWFATLGFADTGLDPGTDVRLRVSGTYGEIAAPDVMWAGAYGTATVEVTNTTSTVWSAAGPRPYRLAYHVYTDIGALTVWDGLRTSLPYDLAPGERVTLAAQLRAPSRAGDHVFAWDMVEEGVAWLSARGIAAASDLVTARALPDTLQGAEWYRLPTAQPVVALTFDCGANADGAQKILDTLAAKGVPATFFLCGGFVRTFPAVARTIASRYPVGNHTDTHQDLRALSDEAAVAEILGGESTIRATTGADPHPLFRFPYGASDARTIALANALGYGGVRWTVDTLGWEGTSGGQTVETVADRVLAALGPGEIVLMHVGSNPDDRSTLDADALAAVIDMIRARGYTFTTLPEWL